MDSPTSTRPTLLLAETCEGHLPSARELYQSLQAMLRAITGAYLRGSRGDTLQPKALVHEAWRRMIDPARLPQNAPTARREFFAIGARAMRQVLVSHARQHRHRTNLPHGQRVAFDEGVMTSSDYAALLHVDHELDELMRRNQQLAQIAELRLFAGLGDEDIALLLGTTAANVARGWQQAAGQLAQAHGEAQS